MLATTAQKTKKHRDEWPRKVQPERTSVTAYRRDVGGGRYRFMVANYADDTRRRFDSYSDKANAIAVGSKRHQPVKTVGHIHGWHATVLTRVLESLHATGGVGESLHHLPGYQRQTIGRLDLPDAPSGGFHQ
jgi:hypothetical protein